MAWSFVCKLILFPLGFLFEFHPSDIISPNGFGCVVVVVLLRDTVRWDGLFYSSPFKMEIFPLCPSISLPTKRRKW